MPGTLHPLILAGLGLILIGVGLVVIAAGIILIREAFDL